MPEGWSEKTALRRLAGPEALPKRPLLWPGQRKHMGLSIKQDPRTRTYGQVLLHRVYRKGHSNEAQGVTGRLGRFGINLEMEVEAWSTRPRKHQLCREILLKATQAVQSSYLSRRASFSIVLASLLTISMVRSLLFISELP